MPAHPSFAKINWMLRVLSKRADGYHELETIFQTISLHDTLTIERSSSFEILCDDPTVPRDDSNLVAKAWRALHDRYGIASVRIAIEKRIPAGGGLGGGSSNAAVTLMALTRMFDLSVSRSDLASIALSIGSDVPFFLVGGTAYARGRGEVLTPLADAPHVPLLLLLPDVRVVTGLAFSTLAKMRGGAAFEAALNPESAAAVARDPVASPALLVNDLETPVFSLLPELGALFDQLRVSGATWVRMSGSGSTIIGAFPDELSRDRAAERLGENLRVVPVTTIPRSEAVAAFDSGTPEAT